MKRWRRAQAPKRASGENVDSLLDTMANVVGILIVMMAVTQLTVNDAMKRIQVWETEESGVLRQATQGAEDELAKRAGIDLSQTLELGRLLDHIRALRESGTRTDTATLSAEVARNRLRVRQLEASLAEGEQQLANLQIRLRESQSRSEEEGIQVRLPDPLPPPPGAKRLIMIARHGRAFDPRLDQMWQEARGIIRRAPRPLARYFDAYDVGNEMLRWRIAGQGSDGLVHRLDWRSTEVGETASEIRRPGSRMRAALAEHDAKRRFIHFWVWGDSFEAYLEARRVAEEAGFKVGWQPIPKHRALELVTGGDSNPFPID